MNKIYKSKFNHILSYKELLWKSEPHYTVLLKKNS